MRGPGSAAAPTSVPVTPGPTAAAEHRLRTQVFVYIALYCLVWWAAYAIGRDALDGRDMVESHAWGIEWQWGNDKHPPLTSWIVAAWFALAPRTDNAYYLLNQINLAAALSMVAIAMHRFLTWDKVLLAVILTSLGTHFGPDMGYKYNPNAAMMPFAAGLVWSLDHALEKGHFGWSVTAGAFIGLMCLTKYYAPVMVLAITGAVTIARRPSLARLTRSQLLGGLVAACVFAPHVWWSYRYGWPSLHYMGSTHQVDDAVTILRACAVTLGDTVHFSGLAILVWVLTMLGREREASTDTQRPPRVGLGIVALGVGVTLLVSAAQRMPPVSSWLMPVLLFTGWALVDLTPASKETATLVRRARVCALVYLIVAIASAWLWLHRGQPYPAPLARDIAKPMARDATALYRQAFHAPVELVAGSSPLAYTMSFYSMDRPHALRSVDPAESPWIKLRPGRTAGTMVLCGSLASDDAADPDCPARAIAVFGPADISTELGYPVYDTTSATVKMRVFKVLMWRPASLP